MKKTVLNTRNYEMAVAHIATTRQFDDKLVKNFAFTLSNARQALELRDLIDEKNAGLTIVDFCDPARLLERVETAEERMQLKLYNMARNLFAMQRELTKENEAFKRLLNQKIETGEVSTEKTVEAGKAYDKVVAVKMTPEAILTLLQLADELVAYRNKALKEVC